MQLRRVAVALSVWTMLAVAGRSEAAGTTVVFTVDVESNESFALPGQVHATCSDGSACGLMEMVRLLTERGWTGTFFLNVYEHQKWGEAPMRALAVELRDAGQDVALHTHPQWVYDPARIAMYSYSLDEQTRIVSDGIRLLKAWTGQPVVAHRAGAYTADAHTLDALERNGVLLDSSLFWQYPESHVNGLGLSRNVPSRRGGLIEVPVTVYERTDRPPVLAGVLGSTRTVRKIDPNWFVNEEEMRAAIDQSLDAKLPVLVVFLHSYSFMVPGPAGDGRPARDSHSSAMFRAMLDHLATKRVTVATMRDLATPAASATLVSGAVDEVPRVPVTVDLPHFVWRSAKALNMRVLSLGLGLTLLSAWVTVQATRRRGHGR